MRIFYAAYLLDEPYSTLINMVRLLCQPLEKHLAHVTIRGPYENALPAEDVEEMNRHVRGSMVRVLGGTYFEAKPSTVYLACAAPPLALVWHKPDYDYHPHITLYDGDSIEIAKALRQLLIRHRLEFEFPIEELYPLTSTPGQQDLRLRASIPEQFLNIFLRPLGQSLSGVLGLSVDVRLILVEELLRILADYSAKDRQATAPHRTFDFAPLLRTPRPAFGCA